jgi:hypothetical protein
MKNYINSKAKQPGVKVDEEYLFCHMRDFLNSSGSRAFFVKSVHGGNGYIEYLSRISGQPKQIEIADLQIISHNTTTKETRLCFLQAKYKKTGYRKFLKFKGNAFQWELLSSRPKIVDRYRKGFPGNILTYKGYATITSYGVFYIDKKRNIDFLFTIPENITPLHNLSQTSMTFQGTGNCPNTKCCLGWHPKETISTCGFDGFEASLYSGQIGEPMNSISQPYIRNLLCTLNQRDFSEVAREFSEVAGIALNADYERVQFINTMLVITGYRKSGG